MISWAQSRAKDRESGQTSIFDLIGTQASQTESSAPTPSAPPVEDFSLQEKLKLEKEYLGFYVSEHPLKSMRKAAQILSPIELNQLDEQKSRTKISAIAILTSVKKIITKKGDPMAFIQLEDVSGQAEGIVFPSVYEQVEKVLVEDARLIVWGKVERREDQVQLIVEEAESVDWVKIVVIKLQPAEAVAQSVQQQLKGILQELGQGKVPVLALIDGGKQRQFIRFGQEFWVQNEQATVNSLINAGFWAYAEPLVPDAS